MPFLEKTLFLLLLVLTGYALKSFKLFSERDATAFINYVLYFALPSSVFLSLRKLELSAELLKVPLCAWASVLFALTVAYALTLKLKLPPPSRRGFLLASAFGNTAFLGFPFTYALLGEEALPYAVLFDQLGSFTAVVTIGFLIARGKPEPGALLRFPPFWALLAGLLYDGPLPSFLESFLRHGAASLTPVVLFGLGLYLKPEFFKEKLKTASLALAVKMLLTPAFVLLLCFLLGGPCEACVLEAGMPPMVFASVLAVRYGLDAPLVLTAVLLGALLAFLTAPLLTLLAGLLF
ncbi:MAG: AEC family transporter [Aquificae bacterium]|nr:AEC family transporter [Aquificota bacterium]